MMLEIKTVKPSALCENGAFDVLDVRTPVEVAECSLEKPFSHVVLDSLDVNAFMSTHGGKPIYILCRSGKRASAAASKFIEAGHEDVYVVEGGVLACGDAGVPLKRKKVLSLERQVRIAASLMILLGVVLTAFVSLAFLWLLAFVGVGLLIAGVFDWCGMALLLSKAPWNKRYEGAVTCQLPNAK